MVGADVLRVAVWPVDTPWVRSLDRLTTSPGRRSCPGLSQQRSPATVDGRRQFDGPARSSPASARSIHARPTSVTSHAGSPSAPYTISIHTTEYGGRMSRCTCDSSNNRPQRSPTYTTLRRRISTLSSWFTWLEDEDINVGNPATRVRRPRRHARPQPWLDRNELTDLLAAAEDEGGCPYALVCLLGLNGLRVSEACHPNIDDLGGQRYQPTLRILGKRRQTGRDPTE